MSDFSDNTNDYLVVYEKLMQEHKVSFKLPKDLGDPAWCDEFFKGCVREMFAYELNSMANDSFDFFSYTCKEFMDFSHLQMNEGVTITRQRYTALVGEGVDVNVHSENGNLMRVSFNITTQLDVLKVFYAGAEYNHQANRIHL